MSTGPTAIDERNHVSDGDPDWQESWAFAWHDPIARIGGWHHLGLARERGHADLWSCIWVKGRPVHREHRLDYAIPQDDLSDFRLGPLALRTVAPLETHAVAVEDGAVSARIEARRGIGPVDFGYDLAKGHWETYGRFEGEVTIDGVTTPVNGHSFVDRSWGRRNWSEILAYRLIWAMFGDDLAVKLYVMRLTGGPRMFGFVFVDGQRIATRHIEIDVGIDEDGVSPKTASATVWAADGRAWRLTALCDTADIGEQRQDFLCGHANAVFDCGGRVGTGFVEAKQLGRAV